MFVLRYIRMYVMLEKYIKGNNNAFNKNDGKKNFTQQQKIIMCEHYFNDKVYYLS